MTGSGCFGLRRGLCLDGRGEQVVAEISTSHAEFADDGEAHSLLRLVTGQLANPMGVVTVHAGHDAPPAILASLNMPGALAARLAAAVEHDVAGNRKRIAADLALNGEALDGLAPESRRRLFRLTFISRVDSAFSIALSACSPARPDRPNGNGMKALEGWIDLNLRLLWRMRRERSRAGLLGGALDLFDFGILLLDGQANILFANEHARRLLAAGDGLRRVGTAVTATDFDNAVRLQTAVQHLGLTRGAAGADAASVMLLQRAHGRPLIATLSPGMAGGAIHDGGVVSLYVVDPDRDSPAMVAALCRAYGLTVTEACLAIRLVGGRTIEDAARQMHIQTQTARAYLKQIFVKTDTHRQADLVRIMLNGVVPISEG